jgi:DNA-binding CsgD family transcriptional regulator
MSGVFGTTRQAIERARDGHDGPYSAGVLSALGQGRAAIDSEVFGQAGLRKLRFFNEVMKPVHLEEAMYGLVQFRQAPPSFVAFCRGKGPRFVARQREQLSAIIGSVTLADAALACVESPMPAVARHSLTRRQRDLVAYVGLGLTNAMIATAMDVSPHTVRNSLVQLYRKLGVSNRAELVREVLAPGPGVDPVRPSG